MYRRISNSMKFIPVSTIPRENRGIKDFHENLGRPQILQAHTSIDFDRKGKAPTDDFKVNLNILLEKQLSRSCSNIPGCFSPSTHPKSKNRRSASVDAVMEQQKLVTKVCNKLLPTIIIALIAFTKTLFKY